VPVRVELSLRLPNSPGSLANVCRTLADEHVNIEALSLEAGGRLHLVVDNHVRGAGVLRAARHHVSESEVVVTSVSHSPGGSAHVLQLAAEAGVNVEYAYSGTAADGSSIVVVGVLGRAETAARAAGV
jgi:hypothetical protein